MTTTLRAPGVDILLIDSALPAVGHTTWNQIARLGEYRGHRQGEFAFTRETFAEIIANFRATQNRRAPVDYEHLSEVLPENAAQEGVPAVAWIVALEDRGVDGLWAAFEWVDPQAVEYVRSKRYLYVSPAVSFSATDKVSGADIGARLTSVALTNHPFLDGMAPLTADGRPAASDPTRLGLSPGDVHIPVGVGTTPRKELPVSDDEKADKAKADAEKRMADDAMMADAGRYRAMAPKMKALMSAAGMPAEATEDALLDMMGALLEKMRETQKAEAAQMADRVIERGTVAKEAREDLVALCLSDRPRFDRMFPAEAPAKPAALDATTKTLLTERVVNQHAHPAPAADLSDDPKAEADEAHALAERYVVEKKISYAEAVHLASRECRQRRVDLAIRNLPQSPAAAR